MELERYSKIEKGMKREFLLLQGTGCCWKKCTFCDYYLDADKDPYEANKKILDMVTGEFGCLDIINSGSCLEFDEKTVRKIAEVVEEKNIHELWFESHWMYHEKLKAFSKNFNCTVHYRCGVETFNTELRNSWNKGIKEDVSPEKIREYFDGICLLAGVKGQTKEDIISSVEIAEKLFDYYSVNLFCPNTTQTERDEELCRVFIEELYPLFSKSEKAEILIENTDLGVG